MKLFADGEMRLLHLTVTGANTLILELSLKLTGMHH